MVISADEPVRAFDVQAEAWLPTNRTTSEVVVERPVSRIIDG